MVELLADLSPETPWGERKIAANRLGNLRNPEAVPGLAAALRTERFWMVRFAIIQALEMIGDPGAIPTLQQAADKDDFQAVRSYAGKTVRRLSH